MASFEFEERFAQLNEEAVQIAFQYAGYKKEIEGIYVYISFELGEQYLVFYRINGSISLKSKLNEYSSLEYDVSDHNQRSLNAKGNELAEEIKRCFIRYDREVPKYLKLTYEPLTERFESKIGYDAQVDLDNMVDAITIQLRWFAKEGGILEPWMII